MMRNIILILSLLLCGAAALAASHNYTISVTTTLSMPNGDVIHYMAATGCNDANAGTSPASPWCTPNHAMNCGDVIVAAAGSYPTTGIGSFGTVSNCPSTTGGIDGSGGIYAAILLCGGSDLVACDMNFTTATNVWAFDVDHNNWAIEGFQVHGFNGSKGAFVADGAAATVHHIMFINNIAYNTGFGFGAQDNGSSHDVPGATGFDYIAYVGNIAQKSAQNVNCSASMVFVGPATIDNAAVTHYLMYGNFAWNQPTNGCGSDVENYMYDTPDAHGVTNQAVILNNIGWSAYRMGTQIFYQNFNTVNGGQVFVENNTLYSNDIANGGFGEINIQQDNTSSSPAPTITILKNIGFATTSLGCGESVGGGNNAAVVNVVSGTSGNENVWFATGGGSAQCLFQSASAGTNFTTNPTFNNTTDLINNQSGAPNCAGFENTAQCMGYDAVTSTLTNPSVIYDLTPTCGNCSGRGYQKPTMTCSANSLIPSWIKGLVYLHWDSANTRVIQRAGLVNMPCGM